MIILPTFDNMKDLLLSLCNYPYDQSSGKRLRELLGSVTEWDNIADLITRHGITALAAYNITSAGLSDMLPDHIMGNLEKGWRQSITRNAWLTERWKEVNGILTGSGIKHCLLKGMALEYTIYGGLGLRQMNDNDILVKKDEAVRAWQLLQDHGFQPEMLKSPLYRKIVADIGKHLPSLSRDGYSVEIHHRLFFNEEENRVLESAIDEARSVSVEGTDGYVLRDDIHLKYLIKHMCFHILAGGFQLRLYRDIELLKPFSGPEVDESCFLMPDRKPGIRQKKKLYRIHFYSVPPRNRFRYLTGDLFPSVEWLKKRHNCRAPAAVLYYPRRLAKLLWLAGKDRRSDSSTFRF